MQVLLYRIICNKALTLLSPRHDHSTTLNSVNLVAKKFEGKDTRPLFPDTASKKKQSGYEKLYELMTEPNGHF